jgi:hypothetical protein
MGARRSLRFVALLLCAAFVLSVAPLTAAAGISVPVAPTITNPANQLTRDGNVVVSGMVDGATVELRLATPSMTVTMAVTPGGVYSSTVAVPVAREASIITVTPSNGFTEGPAATLAVYNLGALPGYTKFVLVDKYDFTLYLISGGVVSFKRPVAIGMPGAQTPTGTWTLGARQWMRPYTTSWGAVRIPLLRSVVKRVRVRVRSRGHWVRRWVRRKVLVKTSYYIHGTNDRDSIGTMASHGCVRMYNEDVIAFSNLAGRSPVVIRN